MDKKTGSFSLVKPERASPPVCFRGTENRKKGGNSYQFLSNEKKKFLTKVIASSFVGFSVIAIVILFLTKAGWNSNSVQKKNFTNKGNPPPIVILHIFETTTVKVGMPLKSKIIIRNHSDKAVFGISFGFIQSCDNLKLIEMEPLLQFYHFRLEPGRQFTFRLVFKAQKAGNLVPPKADIVFRYLNRWEDQKHPEKRLHLIPQNTIPSITILPVRLPGVEYTLHQSFEKTEDFYGFFVLKILGVAIAFLVLHFAFKTLICSALTEHPWGRISLAYVMALTMVFLLIFIFQGIMWVLRISTPSLFQFGLIYIAASTLSIPFRLFLLKNVMMDSLASGCMLLVTAYLAYIGFKAYQYSGFSNFSTLRILVFGAVIGFAANTFLLRKE